MTTYFHASPLHLDDGDHVAPGGWGKRIIATGVRHNLYFRELLLEQARVAAAPNLPSRLRGAFAFLDEQFAMSYAALNAGNGTPHIVYEVEPATSAREASLSMNYINGWWQLCTPGEISEWATGYWATVGHTASDAEVIVDGTLRVLRRRQRVVPPGW